VSTEGARALEKERQELYKAAQETEVRGRDVRDIESLRREVREFDAEVTRVLGLRRGETAFPDLAEALGLLQNCVGGFNVSPALRGREIVPAGFRTPMLIWEYLAGRGDWEGDTGEEKRVRPQAGDYVARMHQRIKAHLLSNRPGHQWPRRHSFQALVSNLTTQVC
jgi:hypothetical protein